MKYEEILKLIYSDDDFDYSKVVSKFDKRVCQVCGKEFIPNGRNASRQRYCNRTHYLNCVVCGKQVKLLNSNFYPGGIKCTCSKACANSLRGSETKKSMIVKYGYENISQVPEFKEKISAAIKAKVPEASKKMAATMKEKYGGIGTASPEIRAKIEKTMQERYGVTNPSLNDEIRHKLSEICSSPETLAKYEATALERWGVKRPSMTAEVKEKMKQTNLERYGVECTLQSEVSKKRLEEVSMEKYGVPNPLLSDYVAEKAREGFLANMHNHNTKISRLNQFIADKLEDDYNIDVEYEFMIGRKSYDFLIKGTKILLEVDPSYTHSNLPNHWSPEGLDKNYHLMKTQVAEKAGYRCIHLFDWDNFDKVASMLEPKSTIYARSCKLISLDPKDAHTFIEANHLQGNARGTKYAYGLTYRGDIVCVATFGKPRYNRHYEWELLRLCTAPKFRVIGGASRLFKKFIEDAHPESVISYCDKSKFTGDVYLNMGFSLDHESEPVKVWSKGTDYVTNNLLLQRGYDQLFNSSYGKGTSNEQLMIENGWRSVYDCGQKVFEWRAK